jgi:hypothetical protein
MAEAGWYPDPAGEAEHRWFDGTSWTEHVHGLRAAAAPQVAVQSPAAPTAAYEPLGPHAPAAAFAPTPSPSPAAARPASTSRTAGEPWRLGAIVRLKDPEDGVMYPRAGRAKNSIELEPADGNVDVVHASAVKVSRKAAGSDRWEVLLKTGDVKVSVYLTDCRVAFACTKYVKGGGWVGGNPVVLIFNLFSHIRASIRRSGKVLVGQVRYPWVALVGATTKQGWTTSEKIRLVAKDAATGAHLDVELTLPKNTSADRVAASIAARCARYRLATETSVSDDERATWLGLLSEQPLAYEKAKWSDRRLGTYWSAQPSKAYGP